MRTLDRKAEKEQAPEFDPQMTQEKYDSLVAKLEYLKNVARPQAIADTRLYGENGDFSENAEYQIAKGRLRGMNRTISELEYLLPRAEIIQVPTHADAVHIGHTVTLAMENGQQVQWKILGPKESAPERGIISHKSPIGAALLGKHIGDVAEVQLPERVVQYTIIAIE